MDYIGGFTFNAVRNLIGALTLLPVIKVLDKTRSEAEKKCESSASGRKTLLIGGICCGIMLCLAANFQQFGIKYTTVGKAGFITACYIIIVPIIGIFLKKKCSPFIWIAVLLSLCGLYLLCLTPGEGLAVGKGELLLIICAVLFSGHILVIDHFSPLVDGVKMSCIQFLVCGILSGVPALLFEQPNLSGNPRCMAPDSLCRSYVKRCSLHPADRRPEKHESDSCFPDSQPGILYFRACRMDNPRTALKQP